MNNLKLHTLGVAKHGLVLPPMRLSRVPYDRTLITARALSQMHFNTSPKCGIVEISCNSDYLQENGEREGKKLVSSLESARNGPRREEEGGVMDLRCAERKRGEYVVE